MALPVQLLAPCLAACLSPVSVQPGVPVQLTAGDAPLRARVSVDRGRARVASRDGLVELEPGSEHAVRGPLHVEGTARCQFSLLWPGLASLRAVGTVSLEWIEAAALQLNLLAGGELFFELRQGEALIEIPSGWVLETGPGALYFHGLPNGTTEVHVDAAGPVQVRIPALRHWPRPPLVLGQGARIRLEPNRRFRIIGSPDRVFHDHRVLLEPGASAVPERPSAGWLLDAHPFVWPWLSPWTPAVAPQPVSAAREAALEDLARCGLAGFEPPRAPAESAERFESEQAARSTARPRAYGVSPAPEL